MERFGLKRKIYNNLYRKRIILIRVLICIIATLVLFQLITNIVEETLISLCDAKVESIGITISNKAIGDVMDGIDYQDLIVLDKDENGKIIALKSNVVEMNNISSEIAFKIQEMYDELEDIYVYVPLRKLYGKQFFSRSWT